MRASPVRRLSTSTFCTRGSACSEVHHEVEVLVERREVGAGRVGRVRAGDEVAVARGQHHDVTELARVGLDDVVGRRRQARGGDLRVTRGAAVVAHGAAAGGAVDAEGVGGGDCVPGGLRGVLKPDQDAVADHGDAGPRCRSGRRWCRCRHDRRQTAYRERRCCEDARESTHGSEGTPGVQSGSLGRSPQMLPIRTIRPGQRVCPRASLTGCRRCQRSRSAPRRGSGARRRGRN